MPERPDYVERALADSALLVVAPQVLAACLPAAHLNALGISDEADAR
jgi:hypothetical protein